MAKKISGPGRSSRTPFKHWVLDTHLGKISGVLSSGNRTVPAIPNPFLCVDLCAGDGTETAEHQSSPRIIAKHCNWMAKRGMRVQCVLIEKHAATFESLEANMNELDIAFPCDLRNADAKSYTFTPSCEKQAVFINCDPNSIADLPFSETLARALTPTTTMTLTLGCNVGGLKRLKREQRQEWFDYITVMIEIMPAWHDAILIAIESDDSQWAYFTRLPKVWTDQQVECIQSKGKKMFPRGVRVESLHKDKAGFDDLVKRLFLTKAEVNHG
jgi:hypothetical protein